MEPLLDRSRIERLVRTTLAELGDKRARSVGDGDSGLLLPPDRGASLSPFDADAMAAMLRSTPARIGVGRAGTRYKTNTLLRFRADHAAAKDAVVSEVDEKLVARLGLVELTTRARRQARLPRTARRRPRAQRRGQSRRSPKNARRARRCRSATATACRRRRSTRTSRRFTARSRAALAARGFSVGTSVFVRRSRVKVMDEIARLVDAEACVFTCGERPGLGFADSLSSYYIYRPASGATDADREVISNINPRGLEPTKAAHAVADACARILAAKKSGVVL